MGKPSLDEFAAPAARPKTGFPSYLDALPEDVREQMVSSTAGHAVVVKWLHGLGYERATQQMVSGWRRKNGWTK